MSTDSPILSRTTQPSTRRKFIAFAGAAAGLPALAACAGSGSSGAEAPSAAGKKPITLRWSPWDGEGQAIVEGANKGVEAYKKSHPWVTVEYVGQTGDFNGKIDAMIAAGDGPEVFGGNGAVWRDRSKQGQFLTLDPFIKKDLKSNWRDDYVPAHIDAFKSPEQGQWSLPMYLGTFGLYYNKGAFRSNGVAFPDESWDWNKWAEAMQKLTVRPDKFGADFQSFSRSRAMMMVLENGGHMVDPKDDTVCVIDQPPALEALQWIADRLWKDHTSIQRPELQGRNGTTLLGTGVVAMIMDGSFRVAPTAQEVPPGVEWDVAPFPKGKVKRSVRATTDGWAIYKGVKQPDEAWDFMKWLQGDEWYEIMMGVVGLTPARVSQQDKWVQTVLKSYPALNGKNLKVFTDAVKQKYAEPEEFFRFHKDGADIIDAAYNDSVRDNKTSVATTMKEAAQRATAVLKQRAGK